MKSRNEKNNAFSFMDRGQKWILSVLTFLFVGVAIWMISPEQGYTQDLKFCEGECNIDFEFSCNALPPPERGECIRKRRKIIRQCILDCLGRGGPQSGRAGELTPKVFALYQSLPNPFSQSTMIHYQLPFSSHITLKVFNNSGKLVRTLVNETQQSGYYAIDWNGKDLSGSSAANGVYFYRLKSGDFTATKKMILLK
jgi:hypothetical protein